MSASSLSEGGMGPLCRSVVRVDVKADVLIDVIASTVNGIVTNIGAVADLNANKWEREVPVLDPMALRSSSRELLLSCWTPNRRWPIAAVLSGCALQAWMPSYHVC